jgi:hypothetical protein
LQRERREAIRDMAAALFAANVDGTGFEKVTQAHPMAQVKEHFSGGVYTRTIFLPAGLRVMGMRHRQEHLNFIACGRCTEMTEFGKREITGPCSFDAPAGTQRFLHIHEDVVWTTVHRCDKTTSQEAFADTFIDETALVMARSPLLEAA